MKIKQIIAAVFILTLLMAGVGCKKDNAPAKVFVLSTYGDTTGTNLDNFTYDANGRPSKLYSATYSTDLYYSGDKLVRRTSSQGGAVTEIDSIYYDAQGRIFKAVNWDAAAATKTKTTVFIFNADNTINSATVDYESASTDDELYEFTYSGSQVTERRISVFTGGVYKLKNKFEYQTYDGKANPFAAVYRPYLVDILQAFVFFTAYPNNLTMGKQTTYDLVSGSVTGITPVTITYTYNSDALPTRMDITQGGSTGVIVMTYQEL